nr:hypothetical protein [Marivita geojedonensis]
MSGWIRLIKEAVNQSNGTETAFDCRMRFHFGLVVDEPAQHIDGRRERTGYPGVKAPGFKGLDIRAVRAHRQWRIGPFEA